jgi:O-antigen/teichoic acid export membrane protein
MLSSVSKAFQEVVPLNFFKSKLLHQSGFYMLGQILQKAVSLLLLPVWTIYLTPSDYGIMGTLAAYSQVLGILLLFGIHAALTRHYFDFKHDHEAQRRYVTSNLLFMAAVPGVILTALILFGAPLWARATASPIASNVIPFRPLVVLMLITVYGGLLYRLPYSLYQAQQKPWKCVALDFGGFVLSVGISLVLVVGLSKGVYGMILGGCIASVVTALVATGLLLREWFVPKVEWAHVSRSLSYGLPFIPHLLAGWALAFVDRVMLQRMVPMDDVGRYTLAITLGMVMLMIVTSIKDAYEPYYYNLLSSDAHPDRKVIRIFSMYVTAIGLLALFGSLFAGELIMLLTPARYHESAKYVAPVILGYLFLGFYFNVGMAIFYYKKTKLLPVLTGIAAVCNITLNYLLIPRFGAIAAAWNTYACYAIMFTIYYIIAQRVRRFPYPIVKIVTLSALSLLSVLVARSIPALTLIGTLQKLGLCAAYLGAAYMLLFRRQSANDANSGIKSES